MTMLREASLTTGQVQIDYVEGPANGPPLVLLHGGAARWQSWEPLLSSLLPTQHVFAPDLRGHGRSGWQAPYLLQTYAADIVELLQQHVREPAILCGHSLGGMVALLVAAQAGATVRGVIVGDAPLSAARWLTRLLPTRPRLEEWYRLACAHRSAAPIAEALKESPIEVPGQEDPLPARMVFGDDSAWFAWMATNLAQLDPASLAVLIHDAERFVEGYALEALLPAIDCPVWLLQADPAAGGLMHDDEVRLAQRLSPWVRHQQLAGVGHPLHGTHPALVRDALLACVRDIEDATVR
jgi:pimeloyl-ACP methyl ester carboxylesterase